MKRQITKSRVESLASTSAEKGTEEGRACGHTSRVLVLGVDSADPSLIQEFVERGDLPTFAKLMRNGVFRILRSAIPDMTAPSWTSIFTGADPSAHGVYGFSQPSGHVVVRTGRKSCKAVPIWDVISPLCQKIVVNIPVMHPVEPINGCMISWIREGSDWIFPRGLLSDLRRFGYDRYEKPKREVQWLCESIDARSKLMAFLLQKYKWCLAAVVFQEIDGAQHFFHHSREKLLAVYKSMDDALARILRTLGTGTPIIIISDHGYWESKKAFFINHWLINAGLLHYEASGSNRLSMRDRVLRTLWTVFVQAASVVDRYFSWVLALPGLRHVLGAVWKKVEIRVAHRENGHYGPSSDLNCLDGLFCYGEDIGRYYRLYLSEDSKVDYEAFSRRLEAEIGNLYDIQENRNPIVNLFKKKDIYLGVHSLDAPDFVLELDPRYYGSAVIFDRLRIFASISAGTHRPEGIFIGYNLNASLVEGSGSLSTTDVVPIVLRTLQSRQEGKSENAVAGI